MSHPAQSSIVFDPFRSQLASPDSYPLLRTRLECQGCVLWCQPWRSALKSSLPFAEAVCLMQAIALIVAHRTDDMSKLPPVITTEVIKKPKQAAGRLAAVLDDPLCTPGVMGIF